MKGKSKGPNMHYNIHTMTITLLSTKFYQPTLGRHRVPRPRLLARLDESIHRERRLTLLCAPAGYGKTTLLAEWFATRHWSRTANRAPVAWLSLDSGDNDPIRFWNYVIAALQPFYPEIGRASLSQLEAPTPAPAETALTALLNELAAGTPQAPRPVLLVLDDYHLITAPAIHAGLAFVLENLPPALHLVITSRTDPPLPLARLRARQQLTELRTADLQFNSEEIRIFLKQVPGLMLLPEDLRILEQRTEGWITGVQLAIHALQEHPDPGAFLRAFAGSHRYVLDYLLEEVYRRQPEPVQTLLLHTAVLDRLCGPLCEALWLDETAPPFSGQAFLETLEQSNLFIVPLDDERRWYRYHPLFADLLRAQLQKRAPGRIPTLHRRASAWYESQGEPLAAIEHALSAADFDHVAELLEQHGEFLWSRGRHATLLRWLDSLPPPIETARPFLAVLHAGALLLAGRRPEAETRLQAVERRLPPPETGSPTPLHGMVAAQRALLAAFQGDIPAIHDYSRRALAALSESQSLWRCSAAITYGDSLSLNGEIPAAGEAYREAVAASRVAGNLYLLLLSGLKLAMNRFNAGRLREAGDLCREQLEWIAHSGFAGTEREGAALALWGLLQCEWNALDEALQAVTRSRELVERDRNVAVMGFIHLALVRIHAARQEWAAAEAGLQAIERQSRQADTLAWMEPAAAAWRLQLWLMQGDLDAAGRWLRSRPVHEDPIPYLQAPEYLARVRFYLALRQPEAAQDLLDRLRPVVTPERQPGRALELRTLQALTRYARGQTPEALEILEGVLADAEPEGYMRFFFEMGAAMKALLQGLLARGGPVAPYATRLLGVFTTPPRPAPVPMPPTAPAPARNLPDPLSERELEVLRLIARGYTNQDIAQKLCVTLRTVKWHTGNLYSKLGVTSRTAALARARELKLLRD